MDNKEKKVVDNISITANLFQIFGISLGSLITLIISIINTVSENKSLSFITSIITIVLTIIFIIYIFYLRIQNSKLKNDVNHLQQVLAERDKQLHALNKRLETRENEVKEQTYILTGKNREFNALNERMEACKDVFKEQNYTPAGHYLIYKDAYDDFRTNLWIQECVLEVEILEKNEEIQEDRLQFKWRLEVINPGSEPVCTANFIYSGDKDHKISPEIDIEVGGSSRDADTMIMNMEVPGDDCFAVLNFEHGIPGEKKATINIVYAFTKDEIIEKFDSIWLVPDALGFSGMDSFCIRFYSNEKNNYANTKAVLTSYSLKGEFKWKDEKNCPFKRLDGNRYGFEAKRNEKNLLRDHGYKLILPPQKEKQTKK